MKRYCVIACGLAAGLFVVGESVAQEANSEEKAATAELNKITVTANKSERQIDQLAGTVSVIDRGQIDRQASQNIKDMIRYEPGVSVSDQGSRFGRAGFRIRGIGGNRVLAEVDGVPVPDSFAIGSFSNANRDVVDPETVKQVEIVRGPASSISGSDALGGVVTFTTKDPQDYLALTDRSWHFSQKLGFNSNNDSLVGTSTLASGQGRHGVLLSYTRRSGSEFENQGDIERDPHDFDADHLLAKWVIDGDDDRRFRLTAEYSGNSSATAVNSREGVQDFSAIFGFPYIVETSRVDADDESERYRISIDQQLGSLDGRLADSLNWRLSFQNSETEQNTAEDRTTTIFGRPSPVQRQRQFLFEQEVLGAEVTLLKSVQWGQNQHDWVYGLEIEQTDISQLRTGTQRNQTDGTVSSVVGPDDFPVRDFPLSTVLEAGLYVQDEITGPAGRLTVIPGLRLDYYDLDPDLDDIFVEDNPGVATASISEQHLSPKLGLIYRINDRLSWVGQYAQGFRAPPYNDVNVGFTNFQFGYTSIPNPDLKPETADSFELGLRGVYGDKYFAINGFYNKYDDFIESFVNVGFNDQGLLVFQSRNVASATIYGAELRFSAGMDELVDGLRFEASASWSKGENDDSGQPLTGIDPLKGVAGFSYDAPGGRWGMDLISTLVQRKTSLGADSGNLFRAPGYGTLDLLAYYRLNSRAQVNLSLLNLTDKTYWDWADIAGLSVGSGTLARLARPGLNGNLSLTVNF